MVSEKRQRFCVSWIDELLKSQPSRLIPEVHQRIDARRHRDIREVSSEGLGQLFHFLGTSSAYCTREFLRTSLQWVGFWCGLRVCDRNHQSACDESGDEGHAPPFH